MQDTSSKATGPLSVLWLALAPAQTFPGDDIDRAESDAPAWPSTDATKGNRKGSMLPASWQAHRYADAVTQRGNWR